MSEINPSISGGVDLSSLANKVVKEKLGGAGESKTVPVPAFSVELTEAVARSVIQISSVVPVLVSFWAEADSQSVSLTNKLETLVAASQGKFFLAKVEVSKQPQLAQAFGVTESCTVAMILNGEPRPLFQGDQSEEDLKVFVERLIQLAKDQGLDGQLVIGEAPSEPELSEAEAQALDAMDRGDFAAAVKIYEQELQAKPNDETLAERLAQVKLVARTFNLDIEAELAKSPGNLAEAIQKADCLLAIGDAESAFSLVLDFFDSAEDKNQVRSVLLEMFLVAGKNHPATIQARKQLAVKMF